MFSTQALAAITFFFATLAVSAPIDTTPRRAGTLPVQCKTSGYKSIPRQNLQEAISEFCKEDSLHPLGDAEKRDVAGVSVFFKIDILIEGSPNTHDGCNEAFRSLQAQCYNDSSEIAGGDVTLRGLKYTLDADYMGSIFKRTSSDGAPQGDPIPAGHYEDWRNQDARIALETHNRLRAQHGANPVVWDYDLAGQATSLSNQCTMHHTIVDFAQNIAAGSEVQDSIEKQWYGEKDAYIRKTGEETGHFINIIWKDTKRIGCSMNRNCGDQYEKYFVCNYYPHWGNHPEAANVQI